MSFFSFTFILFLLIVIFIYGLVSIGNTKYTAKLQNLTLFVASIIFVGFVHIYFALVLVGYAGFIYLAQQAIDKVVAINTTNNLKIARQYAHKNFSALVASYCSNNSQIAKLEKELQKSKKSIEIAHLISQTSNQPHSRALHEVLIKIEQQQQLISTKSETKAWVNYPRIISKLLVEYYSQLYFITDLKREDKINNQDLLYLNQLFTYAQSLLKEYELLSYKDLKINYKQEVDNENPELENLSPTNFYKKANKSLISTTAFTILIALSLLPLIYFKYFDFIYVNIVNFMNELGFANLGMLINVIPVIGISYYTFNSISLLVSVKRGEIKSTSLLTTLTFITYFPTIVAGPINRATTFIPQLLHKRTPQSLNLIFYFLSLGILKKWLLATTLGAVFVQPIFGAPTSYNSLEIVLGVYAYAFQLYFDFSGYTDLMFALGLCFGITHPQNFNNPYASLNIKDFWNRWHMSLSSWIRDFIYIPLGGNRDGFILAQCYTVIAMLLSGIWHGSTINFALWGLLHTLGIIGINILNKIQPLRIQNISKFLARFITFNYVCFTWVFFNSDDLDAAISLLTSLYHNWYLPISEPLTLITLSIIFIYWCFLPLFGKLITTLSSKIANYNTFLVVIVCLCFMVITINLAPSGVPPFIYSNF
ncbi:MBOAT family O-acyltransferase [Psittacicella hinzii]|uniref:Probable alginate O-acetylase AlgI n=1 Tax=Psittacicella hinzii TaxID=2028575 RepID=A0A3A1YL89_9GAMM|nr:MBOAT family O-acyltransferase [Psittacicella hinzii]RIY36777.1 hypothetical protein CKF58_05685 [Psittacicella hinzii]